MGNTEGIQNIGLQEEKLKVEHPQPYDGQ